MSLPYFHILIAITESNALERSGVDRGTSSSIELKHASISGTMQYSKCNFNRLAPPQVRGDKTSPILLLQRALFQQTRYSIVVAVVTLQHFDICNLLTGQNDDML